MFIVKLFSVLCVFLTLLFIIFRIYKNKARGTFFAFVVFSLLMLYVIFCIIFTFNKPIMLLFAVSPFIIGKFADYKYEKLCVAIQLLCILLSGLLVYCI